MPIVVSNQQNKRLLSTLNVDLNLLVVLHALLEEVSVTRAAHRICLSQSATSSALNRLRQVFDDPLLVRVSNEMKLSRRALDLKEPVNKAIISINGVLGEPLSFEPNKVHTTIRICASDYIGVTLLPALVERLCVEAPGIKLNISPMREPEALRRLEKDDMDILIGHFTDIPHLKSKTLFQETFVCLMREGHPLTEELVDNTISLEQITRYKHVAIAREGMSHDMVDLMLSMHNFEREIGINVPHFLVAPSIVSKNDMLVVEAKRTTAFFKGSLKLKAVNLPQEFTTTKLSIQMVWEPHTEDDPALKWIRNVIEEVSATL